MANYDVTLAYKGVEFNVIVEGEPCIYEGIYDDIRLRKADGTPMSERLEKALFKKYGEDSFAENLYEIGEGGDY
jgi:hypothetical protein